MVDLSRSGPDFDLAVSISGRAAARDGTPEREALEWLVHVDPLRTTTDPARWGQGSLGHRVQVLSEERYARRYAYVATVFSLVRGVNPEELEEELQLLEAGGGGGGGASTNAATATTTATTTLNPFAWGGLRRRSLLAREEALLSTLLPSGKDLCTFNPAYVRCDPGTGVVTHLIFRELGLSGTIPSDLGTLHRNLTVLDLGDNHLAGEIPRSLYSCQQLTGLYLKSNRLTGTLPNQISRLQSLRQLLVGQNRLSGEIPGGIQKLKSIRKLFSLAFSSPSGWGLGLGLGFWAWRTRDDS